jgi:toxin ParE1/3/4
VSRVLCRPAASRDLVNAYRYYARKAGLRVAERFFVQARATFQRLADRPGTGAPYVPEEPLHAGLRYCPVSRFRSYLIFYRSIPEAIEIYRVLHAARDIDPILSDDFGVGGDELDR